MPESKIRWRLSEKAHVRFDAAQAALFAFASSMAPLPLGLAMDVAGLDPVAWKQRQMLDRIGGSTGVHARLSASKSKHKRQMAMNGGKALARGASIVLKRSGKVAAAGALRRSIPLVGAAIAFVVVYRQTATAGLAIVENGQDSTHTHPEGITHG